MAYQSEAALEQQFMCRNGTYPFSLEAFFHLQT